jgi:hypothetical protein
LVCQANTTDPEGDDIDYIILWHSPNWTTSYIRYYFGATSGGLVNISTLSASLIDEQQNITCRIYASDGTDTLDISSEDSILILEDYISIPTITNPSSDGTTVENELNITWLVSNSIGVDVHNYTVRLLNTSYSHLRTLAVGQYDNYFYVDFYTDGITPGEYVIQVIANDTAENLVTADYRRFTVAITSTLNVSAVRGITGETINDFTLTLTRGSTISNYSTTYGVVSTSVDRNTSYNLTVESEGYLSYNLSYLLDDSFASLTVNLTQPGAFNLTINFFDEDTNTLVNRDVFLDFIADYVAANYTANNGTISITDLELATYTVRYYSSGYTLRFYTLNISSTSDGSYNLTLYLVNQSLASNITVYVVNELTSPVAGVEVKALKYYLSENAYLLQEVGLTDNAGKVLMSLTKGDEYYKFMVVDNNELLITTSPGYITTDSITITVTQLEDFSSVYYDRASIGHSLVYNPSTDSFRLDYSYSNNLATNTLVSVYRVDNASYTLVNSSVQSTPSGSIITLLGGVNGSTYVAFAYYYDDRYDVYRYLSSSSYTYPGRQDVFGTTGLLGQALLTIGSSSIALVNVPAAMIIVPSTLVLGKAVGLNSFGWPALFGLMFVGFVLMIMFMGGKK